MNIRTASRILITCLAALLGMGAWTHALAQDVIEIAGEPLQMEEMKDIRGGFTTPNGNFLYFSMDFLRLNLIAHNEPTGMTTDGYVNSLRQQALIGKDGSIQMNLDIFQGGSTAENGISEGGASMLPDQLNSVIINDSFTGFHGLSNANIITGNHNVGSIVNIFNVRLGFFGADSFNSPQAQNFFMP